MICVNTCNKYCKEVNKIENYDKAINDKDKIWHCHHKLEIELHKTNKELKELNLYYDRPPNELIFLTPREHNTLHNKYKKHVGGRPKGSCKPKIDKKIEKKPKIKEYYDKEYNYWSREHILDAYSKYINAIKK